MKNILLLNWAFNESQNCPAQGIVTNGTEHFWLSCTSYIAHGILQLDEAGTPVGIVLDQYNMHALDGPVQQTGHDYRHISDGDYNLHHNELWFGIEGGSFPRVILGAIVRYDAETLEFIDIYVHPTFTTMPWLVFDSNRNRAITCNWTDSHNELTIFDAETLTWSNDKITLLNVPSQYQQDGIPFIQGGAMHSDGKHILLQTDDHSSTMLLVELLSGLVVDVWTTGLGSEREGVAFYKNDVLSFGNRHNSFESVKSAQIVVFPMDLLQNNYEKNEIPFGLGVLVGMGILVLLTLFTRCIRSCRRTYVKGSMYNRDIDVTTLSQVDEDYEDNHDNVRLSAR
jgi:hypothetical protein